jgi:hypothetical protein
MESSRRELLRLASLAAAAMSQAQTLPAHKYWTEAGDMARELGGYDAAAWSAPGPLSEESVAKGSAPAKFPDFTRGGGENHA